MCFLHSTNNSAILLLLRNIYYCTHSHCIKFVLFLLILVLVQDGGTPPLSSTVIVICKVLDENDHSPMFLLPAPEIHIPENQQPSVIYITRAVDVDAGNNGALRYKIIGKLHSIIFVSVNQEVYKQQYPSFRLVLILPGLPMFLSCGKKKKQHTFHPFVSINKHFPGMLCLLSGFEIVQKRKTENYQMLEESIYHKGIILSIFVIVAEVLNVNIPLQISTRINLMLFILLY